MVGLVAAKEVPTGDPLSLMLFPVGLCHQFAIMVK
jgi:hypothetical protein